MLILLLIGDLFFFVLYAVCSLFQLPDSNLFSLGMDGGFPECFQYVKQTGSAIILVRLFYSTAQFGFLAWAIIFIYLLLDEGLCIHERMGPVLAEWLRMGKFATEKLHHAYELAFSVAMAAFLLIPVACGYRWGSLFCKQVTHALLVLLLSLAGFGLGVDFIHSSIDVGWLAGGMIGAFEEVGEMLIMSLTVGYLCLVYRCEREQVRLTDFLQYLTSPFAGDEVKRRHVTGAATESVGFTGPLP